VRSPLEVAAGTGFLILGIFLTPGGLFVVLSKVSGDEPTASIGAGIAMLALGAWMLASGYYLALTFPDDKDDTP
jgi:hypothetical protein